MDDIVWYLENIMQFVLFGFLLSVKLKNWKIVIIGTLVSVAIEFIQYFIAVGLAELDDVSANTIGAFVGFVLWKQTKKVVKSHRV